jgi:uncharacterized protein
MYSEVNQTQRLHVRGYEFKYCDTPVLTKSMKIAIQDLKLDHLYIVTPTDEKVRLEKNISAFSIK